MIAVITMFTVSTAAFTSARKGLEVVGHEAGPQVLATADLYYALSDMDAQLANLLLIGKEHNLGFGRAAALRRSAERRAQVSKALLQAADLSEGDRAQKQTIRSLVNNLGEYERLASQALVLNDQADHRAGPPPQRVIELYRRANDVMKLELLPKAYNLTLDSSVEVRRTHVRTDARVAALSTWVAGAGIAVIVLLLAMQVFMGVKFRRIFNPALVLATVGTCAFVLASLVVLSSAAESLRVAKQDGFDSILAMSRTRAISKTMHADETRTLIDPVAADEYESIYQEKSLTVFYLEEASDLDTYFSAIGPAVGKYRTTGDIGFLGFFGDEARKLAVSGEKSALTTALVEYQDFQETDHRMRQLIDRNARRRAIEHRMGASDTAFEEYDGAVIELIGLHRRAFESAIDEGDRSLAGWNLVVPGTTIVITMLLFVGVRPRLTEYH